MEDNKSLFPFEPIATPDKFILKLRGTDVVKYCESQDDAYWASFDGWDEAIMYSECVQVWTPDNSTKFLKDGKFYSFYGFQFKKDGELQPRHFFLFEA